MKHFKARELAKIEATSLVIVNAACCTDSGITPDCYANTGGGLIGSD